MKNKKLKFVTMLNVVTILFVMILKMRVMAFPTEKCKAINIKNDIQKYLTLNNFAGTEETISPYVVGSILITVNADNPGTYLGGSWQQLGTGAQCLFGYDQSNTKFNTLEKTGGSNSITLAWGQLPKHDHEFANTTYATNEKNASHRHQVRFTYNEFNTLEGDDAYCEYFAVNGERLEMSWEDGNHTHTYPKEVKGTIQNAGGGAAFSNLNPYIVVYMWKKTA